MTAQSLAALNHLAAVLSEEGGRPAPATMLLIAWEGVDLVRRAIPRLAAVSGVSTVELESLVAMVGQALDDRSRRVPRQHVVSRVLLRQFCEDVPEGPGLLSTYLLQSRSWKALPPSRVARVSNFVKIDSKETEDLWNLTETDLPAALRRQGPPTRSPTLGA